MAFFKRKKSSTTLLEQTINITPLMDVLTVLLFFLIKIFTVNSMSLTLPEDIKLPNSEVSAPPEETVAIVISQSAVLTGEGKELLRFEKGKFKKADISEDGRVLKVLEVFLKEQLEKRNKIYEGEEVDSELPPGKLLIQADRKQSFGLLKYIFYTATVTGYTDYQFLVENPAD